jgi:hypothetical protein
MVKARKLPPHPTDEDVGGIIYYNATKRRICQGNFRIGLHQETPRKDFSFEE